MSGFHVRWAMSHDWFVCSSRIDYRKNDEFKITVIDIQSGETLDFTDFNKLKSWAGY